MRNEYKNVIKRLNDFIRICEVMIEDLTEEEAEIGWKSPFKKLALRKKIRGVMVAREYGIFAQKSTEERYLENEFRRLQSSSLIQKEEK